MSSLNQILLAAPRADLAQGREPNSVRVGKNQRPANSSLAIGTEGFRRRGRLAFVANLFLQEVLLFDASFLPVHAL
jgi:hypothetical protein